MEKKEIESKVYELKIHPVDGEEFIGTIKIEKIHSTSSSLVQTVILLDRSGSMGDAARRVSNEIIPMFLEKLSYDKNQIVHLITFDLMSHLYSVTVERMKSLQIRAQGGTKMAPAVKKCQEIFRSFDNQKPIRLLTISDGKVNDAEETEKTASAFAEFLKKFNFLINSQAVRLFTSKSQPDTTALCSLLRINNTTTSQLVDISTSETNESIATKIANLFKDDKMAKVLSLKTQKKNILKFPWETTPTNTLALTCGDNLFWVNGEVSENAKIGNEEVEIMVQPQLTLHEFQNLMEEKLNYIVDHMKILKVLGTDEAGDVISKILEYFEGKEGSLSKNSTTETKISKLLASIANDKNVKNLNSAEKAEYLRNNLSYEEDFGKVGSRQEKEKDKNFVGLKFLNGVFCFMLIVVLAMILDFLMKKIKNL